MVLKSSLSLLFTLALALVSLPSYWLRVYCNAGRDHPATNHLAESSSLPIMQATLPLRYWRFWSNAKAFSTIAAQYNSTRHLNHASCIAHRVSVGFRSTYRARFSYGFRRKCSLAQQIRDGCGRLYSTEPEKKSTPGNVTTVGKASHKDDTMTRLGSIVNVPNSLTMLRIVMTPGISWLIMSDYYVLAITSFWVAGFLDWLDGYFARKLNQHSVFGSFLDPLADKVFVGVVLCTLCYKSLIPWELGVIMVGRDLLLVSGSFIVRHLTKPADAKFFGTDFAAGVQSVSPSLLSKFNTLAQFGLLWFTLTAEAYGLPPTESLPVLWVIVGATTVASGADYLLKGQYKRIFSAAATKRQRK